jgi:hypothetical protein
MKVELAEHGTRKWWKEGGNAVWGLGVQFDRMGEHRYGETEDDDETVSQGWSLSLMLGGWSLTIYSQAGHEAIYGTEYGAPWFEVLRA